jgi:hypothetical protein
MRQHDRDLLSCLIDFNSGIAVGAMVTDSLEEVPVESLAHPVKRILLWHSLSSRFRTSLDRRRLDVVSP